MADNDTTATFGELHSGIFVTTAGDEIGSMFVPGEPLVQWNKEDSPEWHFSESFLDALTKALAPRLFRMLADGVLVVDEVTADSGAQDVAA